MFMQRILPAAAAVGLMLSAAVAQAATVSLVQTTTGPVKVGDVVSFDIVTDDDFPTFNGFGTTLTYEADVVRLAGVRVNSMLNSPVINPDPTATGPQTVSFGGFTLGSLSGGTILGSLGFTALATGTASFMLTAFDDDNFVQNAQSEVLFSGPLQGSITVVGDDTVAPPAVPLPASTLLLLGGMGGLAAMRRRQKA